MAMPEGLTTQEAKELQNKYGKNELQKEEGKLLRLLLSNFLNPLSLLLILVAAVTYILEDQISSLLILILVFLNGLLGFYQEYKSERASEKLRKQVLFLCKVRRDGEWKNIPVSNLVPGDVVRIDIGDRVPADLKLYAAEALLIDESVLTGESYPVRKKASSSNDPATSALMGTIVSSGAGEGVVSSIGSKTMFGNTASLLAMAQEPSTFEKNIDDISKNIVKLIVISALFIFVINAIVGKSAIASLLFAVALAVGLAPEALPVIITITLSNGALALSKHGVIAKRLSAIEDLGNVDVLCTDKTGTLTENTIAVQDALALDGTPNESIIEYAGMCAGAVATLNPIDRAISSHIKSVEKLAKKISTYKILSSVEFDYERRRMSALAAKNGSNIMITKGSPESIIAISKLGAAEKKKATELYRKMGDSGYRAIAVAIKNIPKSKITKEDEKDMLFVGFITFLDPPKKTVKAVLDLAKRLGISIKLMSGDNLSIVKHTAKTVGFEFSDSQVLTGQELEELLAGGNEEILKEKIQNAVIFARVSPAQKHLLTKKLKDYGHAVAFLGDGVNDAPAIKEADVGISVNNGSDVTKEAADIILVKKSLNAVVQGMVGGRKIFSNVVKYILNTLAGNFGDLYTIGFASAFIPFIPLTPVQLLLANFLTDAPMVSISTDNVEDEELIKPKHWDIGGIIRVGALFGLISTVFDLLVILYFINSGEQIFRTALFIEILLSEIVVIISLRSFKPLYSAEPPSTLLLLAIIFVVLAGISIVYSPFASLFGFMPLPLPQLFFLIVLVLGYLLATELVKNVYARMFLREGIADTNTLKLIRKRIVPELR